MPATGIKEMGSEREVLWICGRIAEPLVLRIDQLRAMDILDLPDQPMICGSGEPKGRLGKCRGVLLADIINVFVELGKTEHNDTKRMYVIAGSEDGYKTVFSWQEIFNSPNGDSIVVLFDRDEKPLYDGEEDIDLFSGRDHLSGPRYVKRLRNLEIRMLE